MRWSFRPAKVGDLPACQRMLASWAPFAFDDEILAALPNIWQQLLARKALVMTVFEDLDLPQNKRLGGFGLGVFIDHSVIAQILADPKPYLVNRIYQSCLGGDPWPLEFSKVRHANSASGVNLVVDVAFFTHDWLHLRLLPLFGIAQDAFHFDYYGYRFRCILEEVYGEKARDFLLAIGFKTYRAYPEARAGQCPFLMGLTREDALSRAGSSLAFYFAAPAPRFYFRPSQQELLRLALRNVCDQEASKELGVSINTIKRLWKDIFQHVEDIDPAWFPGKIRDLNRRGAEKRRHLLDYLAHHLEELRPWLKAD